MSALSLIGYSGHAYVVYETFFSQGLIVSAYADKEAKADPYGLKWLGNEQDPTVLEMLKNYRYFVSIGDNGIRKKVSAFLLPVLGNPETALHKSAIISRTIHCGTGNLFAAGCIVQAQAKIGNGVICNTGSIIEHECVLGDFVHVAPGAILCGNVEVGECSFIGAGSVIKQGVRIGKNVIIGAGAVILKDIADGQKVVGNPQRSI